MSHDLYFYVHMLWRISCFAVDKLEQRQQSRKRLPGWQLFSMRSPCSTIGWRQQWKNVPSLCFWPTIHSMWKRLTLGNHPKWNSSILWRILGPSCFWGMLIHHGPSTGMWSGPRVLGLYTSSVGLQKIVACLVFTFLQAIYHSQCQDHKSHKDSHGDFLKQRKVPTF